MSARESPWFERWFGFLAFVGRTCARAPSAIVYRLPEVIRQFEQVAVKSLPIVLGAGLSVGL
ncbi:MAG TPA: hypothetical protein VHS97_00495, partial [Isosphaeraceae bacterium]|nr:hypothetical protein [Isosphaeraceae bacterium]